MKLRARADAARRLREENIDGSASTWEPIDLRPYLQGSVQPTEPGIGMWRSDGIRALYPGLEHTVIGEMESGKSWFNIACAMEELRDGQNILYVHFEESDPSGTVERLLGLGVFEEKILDHFRFVAPLAPVKASQLEQLLDPAPSLVILDGVNEAMSLHGWGIRDEDGAASFRRHLVKPCTSVGAAVLSADHVVKDKDRRDRSPLGSIHKGNGLNGALYLLENTEPFGRGLNGASRVFVTKDRPGHLRQSGKPDAKLPGKTFMGMLRIDATLASPELEWWAPKEAPVLSPEETLKDLVSETDAQVLTIVKEIQEKGHVPNVRNIRASANMRNDAVSKALARLVMAGRLTEEAGARGALTYITQTLQDPSQDES